MRRRDWVFLGLCLLLGLACLRLGIWPLDRRTERQARIATIRQRMKAAPLELPAADLPPDPALRRAAAAGHFDDSLSVLLKNRAREGQPGFHLISPLILPGSDAALLVDRGWIPYGEGEHQDLSIYAIQDPVRLQGLLMPSQSEPRWAWLSDPVPAAGDPPLHAWRFLDSGAMEAQFPHPLLPFHLAQLEPADGPTLPDPDLDLSEGPHLSYAIQWFAFASIAFIGAGLWVRRARRRNVEGGRA